MKPSAAWITYAVLFNRKFSSGLLTNINTGKPRRMVTNDFIIDIANRDGQLQKLNVTDRKTEEPRPSKCQVYKLSQPILSCYSH